MTKQDLADTILKALKEMDSNFRESADPTSDIYSVEQYDDENPHRVFLDGTFDLDDLAERVGTQYDLLSE